MRPMILPGMVCRSSALLMPFMLIIMHTRFCGLASLTLNNTVIEELWKLFIFCPCFLSTCSPCCSYFLFIGSNNITFVMDLVLIDFLVNSELLFHDNLITALFDKLLQSYLVIMLYISHHSVLSSFFVEIACWTHLRALCSCADV
jgi:hypothetical protein